VVCRRDLPHGPWTLDAQYNQLKYKDNADKGQLMVLRGTYNLSKRTAVCLAGLYEEQRQCGFWSQQRSSWRSANAGREPDGFGAGLRHTF
jgi:predicted porin